MTSIEKDMVFGIAFYGDMSYKIFTFDYSVRFYEPEQSCAQCKAFGNIKRSVIYFSDFHIYFSIRRIHIAIDMYPAMYVQRTCG